MAMKVTVAIENESERFGLNWDDPKIEFEAGVSLDLREALERFGAGFAGKQVEYFVVAKPKTE